MDCKYFFECTNDSTLEGVVSFFQDTDLEVVDKHVHSL